MHAGTVTRRASRPAMTALLRTAGSAVAVVSLAACNSAAAANCRPAGAATVSGTLAAPAPPCPAPKKAEPVRRKDKQDGFWSGIHIGGSVSTSTSIRGR